MFQKNITIKQFFLQYLHQLLFCITLCISIIATGYFYTHGLETLSNYDAIARLDLARKLIDSITPGFGQLGAIWLPFPQMLTVPFIWNDFMWHTGLAGTIISELAFTIAAVYLQKTAYLIIRNRAASLLVWAIFVLNINVLLFQSMPMSESFFLFCIIMVLYFLTQWMIEGTIIQFLLACFFIMLGTLTRYEGYFILFGSFIAVLIRLLILYWKKKNFSKIEGMLILFVTIAGYGIFLWCLYCLIFFKDPLHWLHIYAGNNGTILTSQAVQNNLLDSLTSYSEISIWMSGTLVSVLGFIGFLFLVIIFIRKVKTKQNISTYLPILVITSILFPLLVYGYQKGYIPHVTFEAINLQHILSKKFNIYPGTRNDAPNIRYGMIMVPFFAIFTGFLVSKAKILFVIAVLLIGFQIYTNYQTQLLLQFSIPKASRYKVISAATWIKSHYTGGLILVSDNTDEDFMFETGLDYKHFIYEGTRQYWTTSLVNPSKYAKWVVYQTLLPGDLVYDTMTPSGQAVLKKKFTLVYSDKNQQYKIYERK